MNEATHHHEFLFLMHHTLYFLSALEPHPNLGMGSNDKERHKSEQMKFYFGDDKNTADNHSMFEKYVRESAAEDEKFLVKFVQCASGSNYLPYDKKFKINIEFNFSLDPIGLPQFHSCTLDVMIPGANTFFYNYDAFKTKMNFAINEVYKNFNMK